MLLFIILRLCLSRVRSSLTAEIAFLRMLSSCVEESMSAVHNIGTQHDGFLTPDIAEDKVDNDCSVDEKNDLSRYSLRLGRERLSHN
ncbi:transcription factor [Salix suchowensis]|nr:transcription factor [Salix suchowensis]